MSSLAVGLWALTHGVAGRVANANIVERAEQLKDTYDYVIAGGGTAGLTVADRLSASGKCKWRWWMRNAVVVENERGRTLTAGCLDQTRCS